MARVAETKWPTADDNARRSTSYNLLQMFHQNFTPCFLAMLKEMRDMQVELSPTSTELDETLKGVHFQLHCLIDKYK